MNRAPGDWCVGIATAFGYLFIAWILSAEIKEERHQAPPQIAKASAKAK